MAPPVFNVSSDPATLKKAQVNLLPCQIQHDGEVDSLGTFWDPRQQPDGSKKAYFRGRKLFGKTMKLPEGYYGMVAEKTDPKPEKDDNTSDEDQCELLEDTPVDRLMIGDLKGQAVFDEVVVWGHESTVQADSDPYVRNIEEWISFSQQIHSYDAEPASKQTTIAHR